MKYVLPLILALAVGACNQNADTTSNETATQSNTVEQTSVVEKSETEKLNEWFEARYEEELMFSPTQLTMLGRTELKDKLDVFTDAAYAEQLAWKQNTVADMKAQFDYDALTDDAKISWDLWEYQAQNIAESFAMRRQDYIFHQMTGLHSYLPTFMISLHNVETDDDLQAYVKRLSELGRAINELLAQAKQGIEAGVRPPRFAYRIVEEQAQNIISGAPFTDSEESSALWSDINGKASALVEAGTIDQARADEMLAAAKVALIESVRPAYQSLSEFLKSDIANTSELAQGVGALPNGEAYYKYRLKAMTTTNMTAEEIHQLGLTEVARIQAEMKELMKAAKFEGSLQEFFSFVRDNPDDERFYYANDDAGRQGYIDDAGAAIENIKAQLPNYFGILPKAGLEVRRVEAFREQDGAPQHYFPGTPDGSRAGIYYAHLSDMKAMPKNELEVIAYHEGLPGHHMQISIAQELEGVPTFRKQAGFTAYQEGWALYSEALAREMPGTFTNIYSDFGRLGSEIWRAIRLVVDTGLHSKGWSQQQAVDYFAANSPAARGAIEAEIRRYLVMPGQATAYKIGMIDIQRLRAMAEQELGEHFDIGAFHDVILGACALPLSMLERRVQQYVAAVDKAQ